MIVTLEEVTDDDGARVWCWMIMRGEDVLDGGYAASEDAALSDARLIMRRHR